MLSLPPVLSVCAAALLVWTWSSSQARACSIAVPPKLVLEDNPADQDAPSAPEVSIVEIERGVNSRPEACAPGFANSCDDLATLELAVAARDDTSTPAQLGYVVEVLDGDPGLALVPEPVVTTDGVLRLSWAGDEGTDDVHFTLRIWTVDHSGKRSAEASSIDVESEGTRGCRLGRASHEGISWLGVLFALSLSRRRRAGTVRRRRPLVPQS